MALQVELEKLDDVDENLRALYAEQDGKYRLQVEGIEDTGALKRAKDHEKAARKDAEKRAKELQEKAEASEQSIEELTHKLEQMKGEKLQKEGNADELAEYRASLETSYNEKLTKREKELNGVIETLHSSIRGVLVDKEAIAMASELAVEGSAGIIVPHIKNRLGVEEKGGQYVTVVLDDEGRPSALTLDELKQEITSNPAFAPVIAGSKATGSGAVPSNSGGGASPSGEWSKMNRDQQLEYMRRKRGT